MLKIFYFKLNKLNKTKNLLYLYKIIKYLLNMNTYFYLFIYFFQKDQISKFK